MSTLFRCILVSLAVSSAGLAGAQDRKVAINFGLTYVPVGNSPVFTVPKAMGFWKEEGLDVEVQLANGTGSALQQLIAGQVVATVGGVPPVMALVNKGAEIVTVASINSRNIYYPVALQSSRIKTVQDMKGAKVGVVSASSSNVYWIKAMVQRYGLNPDKDLELVSVGSGPAALQALQSGRVDVLQMFEASYDQIERNGYPLRRFDNIAEFNVLAYTFGMTARRETLKSDPQLLVGILRGITKGIIYAKANPEAVVRMHWQQYPLAKKQGISDAQAMENDLAILKSALKNHAWADKKMFGYAPPDAVLAIRDTLKQFGELDRALPPEQYYDGSLVEKANAFDHAEVQRRRPPQ